MSYILDALKKSEQERGHGNIPDVQTVHSSSLNYRSEKKTYWPYILVIAVILNLLAIIYFIVDKKSAVEKVTAETQQTDVTLHTTIEKKVAADEKKAPGNPVVEDNDNTKKTEIKKTSTGTAATAVGKKTQPIDKAAAIDTSTEKQRISSGTDILEFHELPESIKQELPTITVSAHVYSTNPVQRSIVINNNFLEEGEYVLDGLILYEITPNGAIFNYQGTLFRYGVVSGWQ